MDLDVRHAVEGDYRDLRDRLDDLGRRTEALARAMAECRWDSPADGGESSLVALRSSLAEERIALLTSLVALLARHLSRAERRWAEVAGRVDDHEEALRMVAVAMRELDDPYGFGESLDERIRSDEVGPFRDFEGDLP